MKTYWFGLLVSALLFSSCGYCARDWLPRESDGITVVELGQQEAENLMGLLAGAAKKDRYALYDIIMEPENLMIVRVKDGRKC